MGKSSLALLLAVATATGRGDLIGFEVVRKGRVVVWNNEDDMNELRLRLRAIVQHFKIDPKDLRDEQGKPLIVLKSGEQEKSEEQTSELQSLMRTSYAGFCMKHKTHDTEHKQRQTHKQ